ncbi:class I SAM-dependent methyltransferase [Mycobacterium sp. AT1]|uniref:class I SAM-dependent methyltransferase n=1 Tax=Mycobacterium sp. AT1 TaxID=1961706 RepID=UPI0009AC1B7B|nr:class I SAM-dependent methyltransferase [Mycobacterium sp. AT1]
MYDQPASAAACRACGTTGLTRVLTLGAVPAADYFPLASDPVRADEASHPLAMDACLDCGLAQLAEDDTLADEPRGVEPLALVLQAAEAVERVASAGWLLGSSVHEFGSPHGGSWIPLLTDHGFTTTTGRADVVLDCFGIMHEPDQRDAFIRRAQLVEPDGVLLLQYHSIATIVEQDQWNALRHGHFAYYSLTALMRLLADVGLQVVTAFEFDLYGGTVLLAAVPGDAKPDDSVQRILAMEQALDITNPAVLGRLQEGADRHAGSLRRWLDAESDAGRTVLAYGAASRAVALFSRAGIDSRTLTAVADASEAKQGRRMPGTDIPIVSPGDLLVADPDCVYLTLPDLLPELSAAMPELDGRWMVDVPETRLVPVGCTTPVNLESPETSVGISEGSNR